MNKITITPTGVKAILIIASLVPLYLAFYLFSGDDSFLIVFEISFLFVTLMHFYYGYKWAKFVIVFLSLTFAVVQFVIIKANITNIKVIFLLLFSTMLIVNSAILLIAKPVNNFLVDQIKRRSNKVLITLKLSRWFLFAFIAALSVKDLIRLSV